MAVKKNNMGEIVKEAKKNIENAPEALKLAQAFVKKLEKEIKKEDSGAEVLLGGSLAKGTYLSGDFDVDIFARFPSNHTDQEISTLTLKAIKRITGNIDVLHGSRDYYRVNEKLIFEIVPVIKVKKTSDARNVADMSPLHVAYFNKKAGKSEKLRTEIRITKLFLKANGLYGAESHIGGFSGHVVDLLLIHYGSFENLIQKVALWKNKKIIDLEKHHNNPLFVLNSSKIANPLIIIDPVQDSRNAAAAVTEEKYRQFITLCKEFKKKPSTDFFKNKSLKESVKSALSKLKGAASRENVFVIKAEPADTKPDVAATKILKIKEFIERSLADDEFTVLWSGWNQKETIAVIVKEKMLSESRIHQGPLKEMEGYVLDFKKKHSVVNEKEGRLYSTDKRERRTPSETISYALATPYVRTKCKSIKLLPFDSD